MKRKGQEERGAVVIVEAALVFPLMFFVIFFILMAAESYYQYAQVQDVVTQAAVSAAARCENPMLSYVEQNGAVPTDPGETDVIPYRYILTSEAQSITDEAEEDLLEKIQAMKPLVFQGMAPSEVSVEITPQLNVFVSNVTVKCEFQVRLPIRMFFVGDWVAFHYSVELKEPIGDPSEFIRNVSTVSDLLERNQQIVDFVTNLKEKAKKIGVYIN